LGNAAVNEGIKAPFLFLGRLFQGNAGGGPALL
jgi:hypothetical protein